MYNFFTFNLNSVLIIIGFLIITYNQGKMAQGINKWYKEQKDK